MAGNRFKQVIEVIMKGAGKTASDSKKIQKSLQGVAKDAAKIGAAFYAAKGGINATNSFVQSGQQVQNLMPSFKALGSQIDMTQDALKKLKTATDGTVNSMELMKMANQAMTLGVIGSEDEMAKLFDTAQRLGKSLGVDTKDAVDSLVTGMGRQSIMMLDNLGIIVDTQKAYDDYAESIGVTSKELTDQQKKIAFNNAALEAAEEKVSVLGDENRTASDEFARLSATAADFGAAIGEKVLPLLGKVAGAVATAIEKTSELFGLELDKPREDKDTESDFDKGRKRFLEIKTMNDASMQQAHIIDLLSNEWSAFGNNIDKSQVTMEDLQVLFDGTGKSLRDMKIELDALGKSPVEYDKDTIKEIVNDTDKLMATLALAPIGLFGEFMGFVDESSDEGGKSIKKMGDEALDAVTGILSFIPGAHAFVDYTRTVSANVDVTTEKFQEQIAITQKAQKKQEELTALMQEYGIGEFGGLNVTLSAYSQWVEEQEKAIEQEQLQSEWNQKLIDDNRELAMSMGLVSDEQKTFDELYKEFADSQQAVLDQRQREQDLIDNLVVMQPELAEQMGLMHSMQLEELETEKELAELKEKAEKADKDAHESQIKRLKEKQKMNTTALGIASNLIGLNEKNAKAVGAIQAAQALVDAYYATQVSFKQAQENPITISNPAYPYIVSAATLAQGLATANQVASRAAAEGMNEIVTEPTLILAGEEGAEYVNIEPTQNEGEGMGNGSQIIFQGNVLSKDFIEDEAIPMIRDAVRRGSVLS